jgi:hypothetical protein
MRETLLLLAVPFVVVTLSFAAVWAMDALAWWPW